LDAASLNCVTCNGPLDPAAAIDPKDPTRPWAWHPTCRSPGSCRCLTPWDEPSKVTVVLGRGRAKQAFDFSIMAETRTDLRAVAFLQLIEQGFKPFGEWVVDWVGREYVWAIEVYSGQVTGQAILTTPANRSAGLHCDDCHQNFGNLQTFQLHKRDCRYPCKNPRDIRVVGTGRPMLIQDAQQIWRIDWSSRFPGGICPMTDSEMYDLREADRLRLAALPKLVFGRV
jgi:hypothetical protein